MTAPNQSVAVIIAAWRAAATIGRAVKSALAEPEALEVVVVDDASDDGGATLAAARAADDGSGRLIVIALERNGGPARARNAALAASRAPWICALDSDDYFEPGRLSRVLAAATDGHEMVADDLLQVDDGAPRSTARPMWFVNGSTQIDVSLKLFVASNIPRASHYRRELGFLKPLVRRAFLEAHDLRYDETMRLGEDYDLYARALAAGARFRLIPCAGYISVMRENSLSACHDRADLVGLYASDARLASLRSLSADEKRIVRAHALSTKKRLALLDAIAAFKAKRLAGAAFIVLRDPRLAPALAWDLFKIAAKRLSGSKD